ncbi:MAG: RNA polymerase sigma factor [Phycisphaerales bacterium]|nr:RNA polymerase sigma factor [Phycisphaerales bacterium]
MSDFSTAPDPTLLDELRQGLPRAQERFVHGVGPTLLAVARRMLSREEDARDAVQDAFLSAFKSLHTFDGRSQVSTWFHRILINVCLMKLRSRKRRPERPISDFLLTYVEDGHQTVSTPKWPDIDRDEPTLPGKLSEKVRAQFEQLPESHRVVIMLRDIEGLSTEETAAALEITTDAVKTRLHRARQALRALLEPIVLAERESD